MKSAVPTANALNPLANPKGVCLKCEICSRPANLQCSNCKVTNYCGVEHQHVDWAAIHHNICVHLPTLRKPTAHFQSEDERLKYVAKQNVLRKTIIDLSLVAGRKALFDGEFECAVPAALQSLRAIEELYGLSTIELVEPYLILAEASIGLIHLEQAEAYLAQAQWTTLKSKHETSKSILSRLNRILAHLFKARSDYESALECLAQDIYYASCAHGPNDIRVAGGYLLMAEVYLAMHEETPEAGRPQNPSEDWIKEQPSVSDVQYQRDVPRNVCSKLRDLTQRTRCDTQNKETCSEIPRANCNSPGMPKLKMPKPKRLPRPKNMIVVADDLFARVLTIWVDFLARTIEVMHQPAQLPKGVSAAVMELTNDRKVVTNDAELAEAVHTVKRIKIHFHERQTNGNIEVIAPSSGLPDAIAMQSLAESMIQFISGQEAAAKINLTDACKRLENVKKHSLTDAYVETMTSVLSAAN